MYNFDDITFACEALTTQIINQSLKRQEVTQPILDRFKARILTTLPTLIGINYVLHDSNYGAKNKKYLGFDVVLFASDLARTQPPNSFIVVYIICSDAV